MTPTLENLYATHPDLERTVGNVAGDDWGVACLVLDGEDDDRSVDLAIYVFDPNNPGRGVHLSRKVGERRVEATWPAGTSGDSGALENNSALMRHAQAIMEAMERQ